MGWIDNMYQKCDRCGNNSGSDSFNYRTHENHFYCTVCGTKHIVKLERDEDGNVVFEDVATEINGKFGFITSNNKGKVIEFIPITSSVSEEEVKAWYEKDSIARNSFENGKHLDENRYCISTLEDNGTFKLMLHLVKIDVNDGKIIAWNNYPKYVETHEEGYGVAKINNESSISFHTITKETSVEDIEKLKELVIKTNGFLTSWNNDKNELVVEIGDITAFLHEPVVN